jgi:hypothetical protein
MLATLNDTKTFLGITGSSQDSAITMLLQQATAYIEMKCGRTFASTVYTNEKYDGTGTRELKLNQYPIVTFTKLEKNNATDNSDDWDEIDSEDYWVDLTTGIISLTTDFLDWDDDEDEGLTEQIFLLGKNKYRATYTAGYGAIPSDLQYACMTFVGEALNKRKSMGIKSESLGDHSISFESVLQGDNEFKDIINSYREINI